MKDIEIVRCRDCICYYVSVYEDRGALSDERDGVCSMWMSDGFYPGDGCTHGHRVARDADERSGK